MGGGYPFTHEAGFNYLEQILNLACKKKKKLNFGKKYIQQIFSKEFLYKNN